MRNLYRRLGVLPGASATDMSTALTELHAEDDASADEIASIMLDEEREHQYRKVHRQYVAAARLLDGIDELRCDDNRWHRRLKEFGNAD